MPITIPPPPDQPSPPNRVRWTREQCESMQDAGILVGRYELVQGEILSKMGQKPAHAFVIRMVMAWLTRVFGETHVQAQLPIHIDGEDAEYNEPEPDCAVLARPAEEFAEHHPTPGELRLVIDVSDTTLSFDLTSKALVYGREGIPEYWIVDIAARGLLVFREPSPTGYGSTMAYAESELAAPLASPGSPIMIGDLLPPQ
jgi:Uma2 family endonuclease